MLKKIYLCLIVGLFWFSLYLYVPIVPTYSESLGSSMLMVGMISGIYGLTQMLLRIPVGICSDRFGMQKPFIIGGVAFAALAGLTVCFHQSPLSLLICRGFGGAAAAAWVPFSVLFSLSFRSDEGPKAMGILNAVNNGGQVLAVALCGVIALAGKVAVFRFAALIGALALLLSFFIKDSEKTKAKSAAPVTLRELSRVPFEGGILLLSVLGLFSQYIAFATLYGFTPIIAGRLGASDTQESLLLTIFTLPTVVASMLSGPLYRRFGGRPLLIAGFLLFSLDCFLTPFVPTLALLYLLTVAGGIAQGTVFPLLMGFVVRSVEPKRRNTAMGFYQAVYGLGMFLGPTIVGALAGSLGITWGFTVTAAVGVIGALLSIKVKA